jgi:MFS family permease
VLLPLALAQFVASYAGSNMNVAINAIATDLGTTVRGVQTVITLFTLTMAALMIPGSKLTDIWGRKFCFVLGLTIYGAGALIAAAAQSMGLLIIGYSLLEGVGSALLIPPIYILVTVTYTQMETRAKSFGIVSGAAGIGAAAGPLIGGMVTSAINWRASFILQVLIVAAIIFLSRHIVDPGVQGERPQFDIFGAVLSAVGLFFVVFGILQSGTYGWFTSREDFSIGGTVLIPKGGISPVWLFMAIGAAILAWFFFYIRSRERAGKAPLISTRLFRNRVSNVGLVTQNMQWLVLQGSFFVISVFVQTERGYNAIQTGLMLTPSTIGILVTSALAQRLAARRSQAFLVRGGFITTIVGMVLLLLMANATSPVWTYIPGLFLMGAGVGVMLTASVNVVQSAFPEKDQGEISGLSRSVSNLGSSLGTAFVGSVLAANLLPKNGDFALALITMMVFTVIGLAAAMFIPAGHKAHGEATSPLVA